MARIDVALRDLRSLEALAARDTPLRRIDARAKVVTTLLFLIVVVSFDRYAVAALLPLAVYPVALAALGDVPVRTLLHKLLLAAPFAVLVGIFNPLVDRAPMLVFADTIVAAGWVSFTSILLRFALTVGAALVLLAGTGIHGLCVALTQLGVPQVFTVQLLFLFRYAFVLGGEAARMSTARELRSNGRALALSAYGPLLGNLLLRAFERAQRVHLAMVARGFDGEPRSLTAPRWTSRETTFTLFWVLYFALVRSVDLPQALGRLLLGVGR